MKNLLALALLFLAADSACAQLNVELRLDQEQFLLGEAIVVRARIANLSGQTLVFGDTDDWLTFNVESREGRLILKESDPPVRGEFQLETSTTGIRRVNIQPHFTFDKIGRYEVTATVRASRWAKEWSTKPVSFNIISGSKIWETDFGVPGTAGPEMRKYALLQAHLTKQLKLYFRVTDPAEQHVVAVFPVGMLTSVSKPDVQLDRGNNCHVLYQNGGRGFLYTVVNPDGQVIKRQTYEYTDSRPKISIDPDGELLVTGGARRLMQDDLPPRPEAPPPLPPAVVAPAAAPAAKVK